MVCVLLAVTNSGTAQTRGRTNGKYGGSQQSMPYQQMFQCMCINSDSGRNAFMMFFGEGTGGRMFHASMEQRDIGHSVRICVIVSNSRLAPKDETLTNVNEQGQELFLQGQELFLSFEVQRQSTGSWKAITIQSWIAGKKSIQSMEISG